MSQHPLNLALRFLLELAGLAAMAMWGWSTGGGASRWALTIGAPLIAAVAWGVFRVPDDGGPPRVRVPGAVRLAIEAAFFAAAIGGLCAAQRSSWALGLGAATALHYALGADRIASLLREGRGTDRSGPRHRRGGDAAT